MATAKTSRATFPGLTQSRVIVEGDAGTWDADKVHTLSVVEAHREGYRYWGYYGLCYYGGDPILRKGGLIRSNDLIHWDKYEGNPIIGKDCRWPTAVLVDSTFHIFYAEYDRNNDSRIVMLSSRDGKSFGRKKVVVPRELGKQNQNPFIFFNEQDKNYYLAYYHGIERSNDKPLVGRLGINKKTGKSKAKNVWQIKLLKSKTLSGLKDAKARTLLTSRHTIASPSITFFKGKYYLLVESIAEGKWDDKWVTLAYGSDKVSGKYRELSNNPLLPDNDACAFQHVFDDELFISYSHCIDLVNWKWEIRMVKSTGSAT